MTSLPDYLWGIETEPVTRKIIVQSGFQTTYEELKRLFPFGWFYTVTASRLPMRNWNILKSFRETPAKLASRLPMRNWNSFLLVLEMKERSLPDYLWGIETRLSYIARRDAFGFQTTYEELKPMKITIFGGTKTFGLPDYLWGIETRYFYLFAYWIWLPDYLWGIETYKPVDILKDSHASRLPMRNWNPRLAFLWARRILLPDYLWGIETAQSWCVLRCSDSASRLPMRNWNCPWRYKSGPSFLASRLPMRNWNSYILARILFLFGFQTTYEELKLYYIESESIQSTELPDYLWGIETNPDWQATGWSGCASRLPMRNWNVFLSAPVSLLLWASRLPMRNWNFLRTGRNSWGFGFQTTYEELKLGRCSLRLGYPKASRLPMRNWNAYGSRQYSRVDTLPDYLWGIETKH